MAISYDRVRRCLSAAAEVLFVAGVIWLVLLTISSLVGASAGATTNPTEQMGGMLIGLLLMLPATAFFLIDAQRRRAARQSQMAGLGPSPRHHRLPDVINPAPCTDAASVLTPPWWMEPPPSYEDAVRLPMLGDLTPSVHFTARQSALYQVQ